MSFVLIGPGAIRGTRAIRRFVSMLPTTEPNGSTSRKQTKKKAATRRVAASWGASA